MTFDDIVKIYEKKKKEFGKDAFKHISEVFREVKEQHEKDWLKSPTPNKDHEQSWRVFKGKNLENVYII